MSKSRCLVFGGGGFIGSHLVEKLVASHYPVVAISRGTKKDLNNLSLVINQIKFIKADFNRKQLINNLIKPNDIVFDLIASSVPFSSMQLPTEEIKKHIFSHVQLIKTAVEKKAKKIIFFSTGGAIYQEQGNKLVSEKTLLQPASPHAISKATIEYFLSYFNKLYQTPFIIYRLSNVYGPRQVPKKGFGIVPTLFNSVINKQTPTLFDQGKIIRDFIYIDDAIDAVIKSFNKKTQHQIYNIASGKGTDLKTLWQEIKKITNTKLQSIYKPKRPIDIQAVILDINRFKNEFNWRPKTRLTTGLKKTWLTY